MPKGRTDCAKMTLAQDVASSRTQVRQWAPWSRGAYQVWVTPGSPEQANSRR